MSFRIATLLLMVGWAQSGQSRSPGLPVAEAESCAIQFSSEAAMQGRWGGQLAVYHAITDADGTIVTLERKIIEGREHLPPRVRLDQFASCLRNWRLQPNERFEVSLLGGAVFGGFWHILVKQDSMSFRLRFPVTGLK